MLGLWTFRDLQRELHRFVQSICFLLEPPEAAVDTLKFEPVRTAAVKVAIEAGWIEGLSDGCPHSSSELVRPGQSEELLSKSSRSSTMVPSTMVSKLKLMMIDVPVRIFRVLTSTRLVTEVARHTYTANARTRLLLRPGVQAGISSWSVAVVLIHTPTSHPTAHEKLAIPGSTTWPPPSCTSPPTSPPPTTPNPPPNPPAPTPKSSTKPTGPT